MPRARIVNGEVVYDDGPSASSTGSSTGGSSTASGTIRGGSAGTSSNLPSAPTGGSSSGSTGGSGSGSILEDGVWGIVNVIGLFFKTLVNPDAVNQAVEERARRRSRVGGSGAAMPNPWQRMQQRNRGRPLGRRIHGVKDTATVKHVGGRGGG